MNLNSLFSLLPIFVAAIAQQSATLPVTVGANHYLVAINRQPNAGHTSWSDALQIVLHVLGGQPGSFTVGVFSVSLTQLHTVPPVEPTPA